MAEEDTHKRERPRLPEERYYYQIGRYPTSYAYSTEPPSYHIRKEFSGGKEPSLAPDSEVEFGTLVTVTTFIVAALGVVFMLWGVASFFYLSSAGGSSVLQTGIASYASQLGALELAGFGVILFVSFAFITIRRGQRAKRRNTLDRSKLRYHGH